MADRDEDDMQVSGTPAFRAPESLQPGYKLTHKACMLQQIWMCMHGIENSGWTRAMTHDVSNPAQVDNWALGVCIYQWIFGRLPFSGASTSEVFSSICSQPLVLPPEIAVSDALADLITSVRN